MKPNKYINQIKGLNDITKNGIYSLLIRVITILVTLSLSIIVARSVSIEQFGVYNYVIAIVTILAIPVQFGISKLVVRETAKYRVNNEINLIKSLWSWSLSSSLLISIFMTLSIILVCTYYSGLKSDSLFWGIFLVPAISIISLNGAKLIGLGEITKGLVINSLLRHFLFLVIFLLIIILDYDIKDAKQVIFIHIFSACLAVILTLITLHKTIPSNFFPFSEKNYNYKAWIYSVGSLAIIAAVQQLNAKMDILMIGGLSTNKNIGLYQVAAQGAILVGLGIQTINSYITPYIIKLNEKKDSIALQSLLIKCSRASFLLSLPVFILFVLLGNQLISFFYGNEYALSYHPLLLLCVAQIINTIFGPVALLLNMTGHEKETIIGSGIALVLNITLNYLTIPVWGLYGAAFSTITSVTIWNVLLWLYAKKRLQLNCSIINFNYRPNK